MNTSGGNEPVADSTAGSDISILLKLLPMLIVTIEFIAASALLIRDKVSKEANQTPQYANIRELDDDGGEFVFRKFVSASLVSAPFLPVLHMVLKEIVLQIMESCYLKNL